MTTGATVVVIGISIDTVAVALGLPAGTHTLSIGTDLVRAADMSTTPTIAGITAHIGTGTLTAGSATTLAADVAANAIGFAVRQGSANAT